jgi:hypothetical protein
VESHSPFSAVAFLKCERSYIKFPFHYSKSSAFPVV